jgi:hypothetical protein
MARRVSCLLLCCLAAVLAACQEGTSSLTLPELNIPGVTRIPIVESVRSYGQEQEVLAYRAAPGDGQTRILLSLGHGLTDFALDGSDPRAPAPGALCAARFAITPDGRWLACGTQNASVILAPMAAPSANAGPAAPPYPMLGSGRDGVQPDGLAWGPDGGQLAVLSNLAGGCAIALYTPDAAHATLQPSALLPLPSFLVQRPYGPSCALQWLSWSPDGRTMALAADTQTLYTLDLSPVLPRIAQGRAGQGAPVPATVPTIPLDARALAPLGEIGLAGPPAWSPSADALLVTDRLQHTLVRVDLRTGRRSALLGPLENFICGFAPTPDGGQVVFIYCGPGNEERSGPPEQLYRYALPS